jgi:hypothetical protein
METRVQYPSDVTDEQWRILVKLLPPPKGRGRKPIDRRRVPQCHPVCGSQRLSVADVAQ